MPRMSISLPEQLMTRLEPLKDRVNISQVCREALESRIVTFEQASGKNGDSLDIENLVARLREERTMAEGKWEDLGAHNAALWLNTVSYLELKNVVEHDGSSNTDEYRLPRGAFRVMKQDMKGANGGLEGQAAAAYKTAWLDNVKNVWAQIQDQVEDSTNGRSGDDTESGKASESSRATERS